MINHSEFVPGRPRSDLGVDAEAFANFVMSDEQSIATGMPSTRMLSTEEPEPVIEREVTTEFPGQSTRICDLDPDTQERFLEDQIGPLTETPRS